jgi:hypothetical protein
MTSSCCCIVPQYVIVWAALPSANATMSGPATGNSTLFVAISKSSDPSGDWLVKALDVNPRKGDLYCPYGQPGIQNVGPDSPKVRRCSTKQRMMGHEHTTPCMQICTAHMVSQASECGARLPQGASLQHQAAHDGTRTYHTMHADLYCPYGQPGIQNVGPDSPKMRVLTLHWQQVEFSRAVGTTTTQHILCHHQITQSCHSINAVGPAPDQGGRKRAHNTCSSGSLQPVVTRSSCSTKQRMLGHEHITPCMRMLSWSAGLCLHAFEYCQWPR